MKIVVRVELIPVWGSRGKCLKREGKSVNLSICRVSVQKLGVSSGRARISAGGRLVAPTFLPRSAAP